MGRAVLLYIHDNYITSEMAIDSRLRALLLLPLALLNPLSLDATKGADVSQQLDNYDFKDCMEAGIDGFVIFQGYRSDGTVNPYAVNNSIGAYEAGFDNFDMYLSPCPRCNKAAAQQVQEMGMCETQNL